MEIINKDGNSRLAATLTKILFPVKKGIIYPQIKKELTVTISIHAPESSGLTGKIPRSNGWKLVTIFPIKQDGKKDYIRLIKETNEKEIWIRLSTAGGRSRVYVR